MTHGISRVLRWIGGHGRVAGLAAGALAVLIGTLGAQHLLATSNGPPGAPSSDVVGISAGNGRACAVRATGGVVCWGYNWKGALGNGTTADAPRPVAVKGLSDATAVSARGAWHVCALRVGGGVVCWGENAAGQLGNGTSIDSSRPVAVTGLHDAAAVSAGGGATCALRVSGAVSCWGGYTRGPPGSRKDLLSSTPVAIAGLGRVTAISVGDEDTCVIQGSGSVACWGWNTEEWLRSTAAEQRNAGSIGPTAVGDIDDATAISTGDGFSCAVRRTGGVACWGEDFDGQLGHGTANTGSLLPVGVRGLRDATAVSAGGSTACAIHDGGRVACWGDNSAGKLGVGTTRSSSTPVDVSRLSDAIEIAVGHLAACALRPHGRVLCWGVDSLGELGDGEYNTSKPPPRVTTPHSVVGL